MFIRVIINLSKLEWPVKSRSVTKLKELKKLVDWVSRIKRSRPFTRGKHAVAQLTFDVVGPMDGEKNGSSIWSLTPYILVDY